MIDLGAKNTMCIVHYISVYRELCCGLVAISCITFETGLNVKKAHLALGTRARRQASVQCDAWRSPTFLKSLTAYTTLSVPSMWSSSKKKSVDLTHFESKSSGLDSGADTLSSSEQSSTSDEVQVIQAEGGAESIAIVGSGDFGRALALRMVQSGYVVNIGSRNPQRNK